MMGNSLPMWTVTANPSDFPGKYVARKFVIMAGVVIATDEHVVADTLNEVRAMLPAGLTPLPRSAGDDPVIVESWL